MLVINTINHAVFDLQSLADDQKEVAHAQRSIPFPPIHSNRPVTMWIVEQAQPLKQVYHAVE